MAERAVSSVFEYLAPLLTGEVELLKGVRKEIVSIKAELERIHSFLKDAESRAETGDEGVKIWVKQVRQVAYRIQDVIDEHILLVLPKQPGLFSSLHKVTQTITRLKPRHEIASQIQDIKTTIREIKEGADRYAFSTSTSSEHSSTSKDKMWRDPRLASLFIGDDEELQWITSMSFWPYPKRRLGNSSTRKPSNWTLEVIVPLSWRKYHKQLLESVKVCHLQLQL
ncbi:hypothetical protein ACSBR1_040310 [Camellia fascicularis]